MQSVLCVLVNPYYELLGSFQSFDIYSDKKYNEEEYPKYENFDAINVDVTKDIPVDYAGAMGVPIRPLS